MPLYETFRFLPLSALSHLIHKSIQSRNNQHKEYR
nr:MAG TPA: hypothetical protein [Caudoviricetes sp.]